MSTGAEMKRRPVKLAEQMARDIVRDIELSGLGPGNRLPSEAAMAESRGISRATVREALRILEVHGMIKMRSGPGGGPELLALDHGDFARMATLYFHTAGVTFRQLLSARSVLEPRVAELAARNRTKQQLADLRANVARHEKAETVHDLMEHAHAFHQIVAEMAGRDNSALAIMASSLHGIFEIYQRSGRGMPAMQSTAGIHAQIADAIEQRDVADAGRLMEQHLEHSAVTFEKENPSLIDSPVSWLSW